MRNSVLGLLIGGVCVSAGAGAEVSSHLQTVDLPGGSYYIYQADKDESLFGISRRFNWNDSILAALNPAAAVEIKKGIRLFYPKASASKSQPSSVAVPTGRPKGLVYKIKPEDTLAKIAGEYNVSAASIFALNPGLYYSYIPAGDSVRLPAEGSGLELRDVAFKEAIIHDFGIIKASKGDTWESIARKAGINVDLLKAANPGETKIKPRQYVNVPNVDSISVTHPQLWRDNREGDIAGLQSIYEEVHNLSVVRHTGTPKIAVVTGGTLSKSDVEFLRGAAVALDLLAGTGTKVDFTVVEPQKDTDEALRQLLEISPNIIFLTDDKEVPEWLDEYSMSHHVPTLNVFDVKSDRYLQNPYIIQLLAPSQDFNESVARHITELKAGRELVVVSENIDSDQFGTLLTAKWPSISKRMVEVESISPALFKSGGKYIVYVDAVKKNSISKALTTLQVAIEQNPLADVEILGKPNWMLFDESLKSEFDASGVIVPSRFYFDRESSAAREFLETYKKIFGTQPLKSVPTYAAVGYDVTRYFAEQLCKTNGDIQGLAPSAPGSYIQNPFEFRRQSNWQGMVNSPVYILNYNTYGITDKDVIETSK